MTCDLSTVGELLEFQANRRGDADYVLWPNARYTFADALTEARHAAAALHALGVSPGDRVAIMLQNRPEYLWTVYGLALLAAIAVPLPPQLHSAPLSQRLAEVAPALLVAEPDCARRILPALPNQTSLVTVGPDTTLAPPHFVDLWAVHAGAGAAPPGTPARSSDPFLLMYTSGMTGPAKGVLCSHGHAVSAARYASNDLRLTPEDCFYTQQPLFHPSALWWGCLTALWTGSRVALSSPDPSRFWGEAHDFGATWIKTKLATLLHMTSLVAPLREGAHHVRNALVTPMPLPTVQARLERRFNVRLASSYGMTELHLVSVRPPSLGRTKPGSVGKAGAHDDVRIVDTLDRPVPTGVVGEIVVRPCEPWSMTTGYWHQPALTVQAWRNLWFHTSDLGSIDADGYLYFYGRKAFVIHHAGQDIAPIAVERLLCVDDAVEQAAVVAAPGHGAGDDIAAYIVPAVEALTERDVLRFAVKNLPPHMVPRYIELVGSLPLTPSLKLDRLQLTRRATTKRTRLWDRCAEH